MPDDPRAQHDLVRNLLLSGILSLAIIVVLTIASVVFIPIFMAFFFAAVLRGPVRLLMDLRLSRGFSAVAVISVFFVCMTGLGALVYAPVSEWSAQMPVLMERLDEKLSPIRRGLQDAQRTAEQIEQATEIEPGAGPTTVVVEDGSPLLSQLFAQSRLLLGQIAATAILTFFLLATGDPLISDRFLTRFGSPGQILIRSLEKATHQMSRYISTMTILNASVGVLCGLVAYFAGLPSPILWGLAIAVLNFVPYLGPLVAALAVAVVSFLTFDSFWQTAVPVLLIITIQFLEGEVLTPMILGRVMELHPVAIIVSVLIWGWMWGLAGAFLAVPILMTGAIIMNELFADGEQRPEDCQAVTESPQRRRRKAS